MEGDVLTIGMASDPPFAFRESDNTWASLAPELGRKLAAFLCKEPEFVNASWSTVVAALQARKFMIFGGELHKTEERAKVVAFATPFLTSGTSFWVDPTRTPQIKTTADLNDPSVTISLLTGSDQQTTVDKYFPKATQVLLPNATPQDQVLQLQTGKVMVLSQSSHMAAPFASVNPGWLALPEQEGGEMADLNPLPAGFGLNMDDTALLEATNAFMDGIIKSGELDAMFEEYITLENYNRPVD